MTLLCKTLSVRDVRLMRLSFIRKEAPLKSPQSAVRADGPSNSVGPWTPARGFRPICA